MSHYTPSQGGQLKAIGAVASLVVSTLLFFVPVFIVGLLKLFPHKAFKTRCAKMVDAISTAWCARNNWAIKRQGLTEFSCVGLDAIAPSDKYLVIANHQSWLDIVVLHYVFTRKIPVLKFFIKDQLKWVPFLGFAWWAMGCPFMKRYSKDYLANNPHKKLKDAKATQKAIQSFQRTPSAIMNFVEGTRFSKLKHSQQQAPYQHLLKPKAGGIEWVISAMGEHIQHLVDVTIVYGVTKPTLWDFLCKRIPHITVHVRQLPIPATINSRTLAHDPTLQTQFRAWLNQQWAEKDHYIAQLRKGSQPCIP